MSQWMILFSCANASADKICALRCEFLYETLILAHRFSVRSILGHSIYSLFFCQERLKGQVLNAIKERILEVKNEGGDKKNKKITPYFIQKGD